MADGFGAVRRAGARDFEAQRPDAGLAVIRDTAAGPLSVFHFDANQPESAPAHAEAEPGATVGGLRKITGGRGVTLEDPVDCHRARASAAARDRPPGPP